MQRMKGQGTPVPNGPKDQNYSSFQNYTNPMTTSMAAAASDPYMSSFYMTSTPYQAFGVGDGTWSNGGEHMHTTFLGGYGGQVRYDSHNAIDGGIFSGGSFGGFNAPSFNYSFHGNGDYSAWGRSDLRSGTKPYDEYYHRNVYQDERVKELNIGVQGLALADPKILDDIPKDGQPIASNGAEKFDHSSPETDEAPLVAINQPKKGLSWANVASQPAKTQPSRRRDKTTLSSIVPGRHMDIGTWESKNGGPKPVAPPPAPRPAWDAPRVGSRPMTSASYSTPPPLTPPQASQQQQQQPAPPPSHSPLEQQIVPPPSQQLHPPALVQHSSPQGHQQHSMIKQQHSPPILPSGVRVDEGVSYMTPVSQEILEDEPPMEEMPNDYNPKEFDLSPKNSRFFVIKSYSEDDIHRSIKYEIWCSTEHGNKRLDNAFREREGKGPIYLFFSVNGSGHFCGIAQMISYVDYNSTSNVWAQDKWKGQFRVKWIYVKDVPNNPLRHIRLENNENKPVTNSRDTQEVPYDKGKQVLKIIHNYRHTSSIFDDFIHYEKRQEESEYRKGQQPPTYKEMEREEQQQQQHIEGKEQHRNDYRDQREHPRDQREHPRDQREHPRDQREHPRDFHRDYQRGGGRGGRGGGGGHHRGSGRQ